MAICCDIDSPSSNDDESFDPFEEKVRACQERQRRKFQNVLSLLPTDIEQHETALTQLFLVYSVSFADDEMRKILRIEPDNQRQRQFYNSLLYVVRQAAIRLKQTVNADSLKNMPMSDLRRVCYQIADCYDTFFYVPVRLSNSPAGPNLAMGYAWKDRFNHMWPVLSLLNREYNKLAGCDESTAE